MNKNTFIICFNFKNGLLQYILNTLNYSSYVFVIFLTFYLDN